MMRLDRIRLILFSLFVLSGFCSLLYETIWLRLAYASFGIITPVMSIVLSTFMVGLALGSWAGGKWIGSIRRKSGASAIQIYAVTEFLIGLGAFLVPISFSAGEKILLSLGGMNSFPYLLVSAFFMAVSILPWCILMGLTFPFMLSFIQDLDASDTDNFSFLYAGNVIGAMTGTLLTAFVLIELLGFKATLTSGAVLNFIVSLASFILGKRHPSGDNARPVSPVRTEPLQRSAMVSNAPARMLTPLFATGLASMGMEVVWIRGYVPLIGTQIYSFAFILSVYLFATWVGSLLYRRHLRRDAPWAISALITALFAASLLPLLFNDLRLIFYLEQHLGISVGIPVVFLAISPFCFLAGYLTPMLIDTYSLGRPGLAGRAYAINIIGCVIGPLLASYVLVPFIGIKWSLILLSSPFLPLSLTYGRRYGTCSRWRTGMSTIAATVFLLSVFLSHSNEEYYKYMDPSSVVRRDHAATVISFGSGLDKQLLVNGQPITMLVPMTKHMAHLPLLFFHGTPRSSLVICFGMGTTYRSLLSWGIDTTAVELSPSVRDAFGYYFDDAAAVLANPSGRIIIDDGRRFLNRTDRKFDVITLDPPPPVEAAGVSLLMSREFYASLKNHLTEGGVVQQWFPEGEDAILYATARALANSFTYVRVFRSTYGWGRHFIASDSPLILPPISDILSRMPVSAQKDLLEWEDVQDAGLVLSGLLHKEVGLQGLLHPDTTIVITDDRPYNEYYMLRRLIAVYHNYYTVIE